MRNRKALIVPAAAAAGVLLLSSPAFAHGGIDHGNMPEPTTVTTVGETTTTVLATTTTTTAAPATTKATTSTTVSGPTSTTVGPDGLLPMPSGAQWSYSPGSGPVGTTITASGTKCLVDGKPGLGMVFLFNADLQGGYLSNWANANADGSWSAKLAVVDRAPGVYALVLACGSADGEQGFLYGERTPTGRVMASPFVVTEAPAVTPTPGVENKPAPGGVVKSRKVTAVKPATAVKANPAYTG